MTQSKDAWWRPVALLMLSFAIGMDLLVWQLSGGVQFSKIVEQMIDGFILAFAGTSLVLLTMSLGSVHRYAQWKEQIFGLLLLTMIGFYLTFQLYNGESEDIREGGAILLSGLTAMLTAIGLVFGLLLALVTGREHFTDPLLEMESTGGDVDIEANQ
tara:strand:+ start:1321 stop:1791 length:471 start_codon:yes stop_codon:yes gene_type:complete